MSLAELQRVLGPAGTEIERDLYFTPTKPLSDYAREARSAGHILA